MNYLVEILGIALLFDEEFKRIQGEYIEVPSTHIRVDGRFLFTEEDLENLSLEEDIYSVDFAEIVRRRLIFRMNQQISEISNRVKKAYRSSFK